MAWIKFEVNTSDKPEVWYLANQLDIEPDAVVGKLLRIWAWFDEHTVDGNAPSVTEALLDAKVNYVGFCNEMINAGWMVRENGTISLPNFDRHNGKTAKNRGLTAKRVSKFKASNDKVTGDFENGNDSSVSAALPREDKIREEKNINTKPPKSPLGTSRLKGYQFDPDDIPARLCCDEFLEAWATWLTHRRELKKPVTKTQALKQLAELAELPPTKAVEMIDYTIARGWQGLRAPEPGSKKQKPADILAELEELQRQCEMPRYE